MRRLGVGIPAPTGYAAVMTEAFFTSLLVLMSLLIVWFAGFVVYRLFKG